MRPVDLYSFVAAKKGIALILLLVFCTMGIHSGIQTYFGTRETDFLHEFYTILILTDILRRPHLPVFSPQFSRRSSATRDLPCRP